MEAEVKENSENVAPSTEQSLLKHVEEVKDDKPSETETVKDNQQQQKAEKGGQTSADGGDSETRQVRIRKQVQRFSDTLSKRYADEQAAKEKAHDAVASQFGKGSGTPLGDIPLIESSIRGCKPMDLKTLHHICFGRIGSVAEVRSNLRKFSGFSFDRDSEEYGKRVQILSRKSVKEVQNALRVLHLEVSGTRAQIVARLFEFLLKPEADAVKYKGKLPPSKRRSGAGRKSLSKLEESDKEDTLQKPKKNVKEGETESDELGDLSDGDAKGEEEESEHVAEPRVDEEDEYEEEEEEESGKSDVDYAPGKKVVKKRKSTVVARKTKSPRKAKRRRKQVIESDEDDGVDDGDANSSAKEEEEDVEADVKSANDGMKEPKQVKGADNAEEGTANDNDDELSSKIASHSVVFPTDEELKTKVLEILKTANLNEVSMKVVRNSVSEQYKDIDLSPKKQFINSVIEEYLASS